MRKIVFLMALAISMILVSCDIPATSSTPVSSSGVKQATVKVKVGSDGFTTEQRNVADRLDEDNKIGAIKHLYVISAYSGQVIIYSTVKGKVTSSGKRLTPTSVSAQDGDMVGSASMGMKVDINGETHRTEEVIQDDGTYGSSNPYLFWRDVRGVYHQHYVSGGQILHISSEPIPNVKIILNLELIKEPK